MKQLRREIPSEPADRRLALLFACLSLIGACDPSGADTGGDVCGADAYAHTTGDAVYVSASCAALSGGGTANGSLAKPFADLSGAIAAATPGQTILVAAGTYAGPVLLADGVHLIGAGSDRTTVAATGDHVVRITGSASTAVSGVSIQGGATTGISVTMASVIFDDVIVAGMAGNGIDIEGSATVDLKSTALIGNGGVGLVARGTGKVSIIEPTFSPVPTGGTDVIGIIEPTFSPKSHIADNSGGGIAIIEPTFAPKGDDVEEAALVVRSTDIDGNGRFGIGLWSAGARIEKSAIRNTIRGAKGMFADGILVAAAKNAAAAAVPVKITIDAESLLVGQKRTGILVTTATNLTVAGVVAANGQCGIWASGASTVVHVSAGAMLHGNGMVGVAVSKGADLRVDGATIQQTTLFDTGAGGEDGAMGDGIGVYDGARATIANTELRDNTRAAIVIQNPAETINGDPDVLIEGTVVVGGKYGVVLNGAPMPESMAAGYERGDGDAKSDESDAGANDPGQDAGAGGGTDTAPAFGAPAGDLPVETSMCDAEAGDTACVPEI